MQKWSWASILPVKWMQSRYSSPRMSKSFRYAMLSLCYSGYIIFHALCLPGGSCQFLALSCGNICNVTVLFQYIILSSMPQSGSIRHGPDVGSCYVSARYWWHYLYPQSACQFFVVCYQVLVSTVAMFQCYIYHLIFIIVCMSRSQGEWVPVLVLAVAIWVLYWSYYSYHQCAFQDPCSMRPGPVVLKLLLCFNATLIILF